MDIFPHFMSYLYRPHAKVMQSTHQLLRASNSKMKYIHGVCPGQSLAACLLRFSEMSRLKKIVALVIATRVLEEETISSLTQEFKSVDVCGGPIDLKDLIQSLRHERCLLKRHQIQHLMDAADLDKNGTLDSHEFLAATLPPKTIENEQNVAAAFTFFDRNHDGFIELSEVYDTCKNLNLTTSMEELKALFSEVDQNGDGRIDRSEFMVMMRGATSSNGLPSPDVKFSTGANWRVTWLAHWTNPMIAKMQIKEAEKLRRNNDHSRSAQTRVCTHDTPYQFEDVDKLRWLEIHTDVEEYSRQNVDVELAVHDQKLKVKGIPPSPIPVLIKSASLPSIPIDEDNMDAFYSCRDDQQYDSKLDICSSKTKAGGDGVVFAGHRVPYGKMEFFFLRVEDMVRVVGVGLEYAKVEVGPKLEVHVIGVEKEEWDSVWQSWNLVPQIQNMQVGVGQFYFGTLDVSMFQIGDNEGFSEDVAATPEHLSDEQMARTFGVSLKGGRNAGTIMSHDLHKPQDDGTQYVPLTYGLVKQLLKEVGNCSSISSSSTIDNGAIDLMSGNVGTAMEQPNNDLDAKTLCRAMGGDMLVGDNDKGKQLAEVSDEELEENMLKVIVRPIPGGVFYMNKTQKVPQPPNQELKDVSISPKLVFHFIKKGKFDKKMDIRLKPMFNLNGVEPDDGKGNSFGWYQDRIQISMSCAQAYITKPPCFDEIVEKQIIDLTDGLVNSDSVTAKASTRIRIGLPHVVSIQPEIGGEGTHREDAQSQQTTRMMTTEILRGFNTIDRSDIDAGRLHMHMIFAHELTPNIWTSHKIRQAFAQSGICQNLRPKIKSTWRPKNNAEREPYFFCASRDLSLYQCNDNTKSNCTKETFTQHFNVQMFVNHEMSHLKTKAIPKFQDLKEGEKVDNVIEVSNPISF